MGSRVLIIGGDAAGMTTASTLRRRLSVDHEVVVLERGERTSYSACGIPYWVAGEVESADALVARSPDEHRANGIDLRTGTEAIAIDLSAQTVTARAGEGEFDIHYDRLMIATGAEPFRPDLPGIHAEGIEGVQTLGDGEVLIDALDAKPKNVVVVGSGYIGLEIAEACARRGLSTTVVERNGCPLPIVEPELGAQVAATMRATGLTVLTGTDVTGFTTDSTGKVAAVVTSEGELPADLVVLGLGVSARSALAAEAGLELGAKGGIVTDDHQRVPGFDTVWSAGDCVVARHQLTDELVHMPLGTHANKQGLVAADSIAADIEGVDSRLSFPGVIGTAITRICALEISRTGLSIAGAKKAGFDPVSVSIETSTLAGYLEESEKMTVMMWADRSTRRVIGTQIVGGKNSALRIDAAATAMIAGMTADDIVMLDLAYAPPFSSVWSPIQVAARSLTRALDS